jgi:hypothetical protein
MQHKNIAIIFENQGLRGRWLQLAQVWLRLAQVWLHLAQVNFHIPEKKLLANVSLLIFSKTGTFGQ